MVIAIANRKNRCDYGALRSWGGEGQVKLVVDTPVLEGAVGASSWRGKAASLACLSFCGGRGLGESLVRAEFAKSGVLWRAFNCLNRNYYLLNSEKVRPGIVKALYWNS